MVLSTDEAFAEQLKENATATMLNSLLNEFSNQKSKQVPSDEAIQICVKSISKPIGKALGGKAVLVELAANLIDAWLAAGIFISNETPKKIMLKLAMHK